MFQTTNQIPMLVNFLFFLYNILHIFNSCRMTTMWDARFTLACVGL